MRHTSVKRAAQLAEYTKLRRAYLESHRNCQICARRRAIDVHHRAGREGKKLLAQEDWLAVCRVCHDKIHQDPRWAREAGYRA